MKRLFIIDDTLSNKVTYYHLVLFLVFLPFTFFYSEVVLISLCVHTIIHLKKEHAKKLLLPQVVLLQSVFLLTLISNFYAHNITNGFSLLTRQLAIFLLPILLFVSPIYLSKYRSNILAIFSLTCVATILYLYLDALRVMYFYHFGFSSLFSPYFINHNFSLPIGLHATYLSMYAAISLSYLLTRLKKAVGFKKRLFILAGILILTAGLLQLASRSVLISAVISACVLFPILVLKKPERTKFVVCTTLVLIIIAGFIFYNNSFKNRYVTDLSADLKNIEPEYAINNTRMQRWEVAWQLIKESPVIGHGSGDEVDLLREKYFDKKYYSAFYFRLNAHNQYLSFLIKGGIVGLLIYLFTLFYSFRLALKNGDFIFISLLTMLAIVSVSENYLDVNKGIFFYAFFLSFFIRLQIKPSTALHLAPTVSNQQQQFVVSTN